MSYYIPKRDGDSCLKSVGISCGARWVTWGWKQYDPGQNNRILSHNQNQYIYLYAFDDQGRRWEGNYYKWVINKGFQDGEFGVSPSTPGAYKVGFWEVNMKDYQKFTMTIK
jgi:uncharacterized membrane protein